MPPFDPKPYLQWWKRSEEPAINAELYISPFKPGTPEWEEDVKQHSETVNGVIITGRQIKK